MTSNTIERLQTVRNHLVRLRASFQKFTSDRAEFEAGLASQISEGGFDLGAASVERYARQAAAVGLAKEIEPRLKAAIVTAWRDAMGAISQAHIDVANQHREIDLLIRESIISRVPADVAGAVEVDFKKSATYAKEIGLRAEPRTVGGSTLEMTGDAPAERLTQYVNAAIAEAGRMIDEFARTDRVIAELSKKAA